MSIIRRSNNIFDPFSLDLWNPFESITPSFDFPTDVSTIANTRIDWRETPDAHYFKADLPGLSKEEVRVEVEDGGVLQISGERRREVEEIDDRWHRVERSSGKFIRRFRLPENVRLDQVKAAMESGVLTVVVPKEEVRKAGVRPIAITGS